MLEIRAIYIDTAQQSFLSSITTVQHDYSNASTLRAKRGAFEKAMEYVVQNLNIKGTP